MTLFFALPDEVEDWVSDLVGHIDLVRQARSLHAGGLQVFLWPRSELTSQPTGTFGGVMVHYPQLLPEALTAGDTGWKASAFDEAAGVVGSRLNRQVTRSLRRWVVIPLFAVSSNGQGRGSRPSAWGSAAALDSGVALRQFREGTVRFVL